MKIRKFNESNEDLIINELEKMSAIDQWKWIISDDIRNDIETQKIDYIYNILDHYKYFSNEFNLSEYIEEIESLNIWRIKIFIY